MKKCSMCKEELSLDRFNKNAARKDGLQSMCSDCWKSYYRDNYYQRGNEKDRLKEKREKLYADARAIIREAKNKPCADCGESYPSYVMDFDHLDPSQKLFDIAKINKIGSIRRLNEEINKCEVVCSNCHRERTHGRER